jgi:hypothetical protein
MKRYMAYSFCTLWTLVLIVALIAGVVHQVRYQDSADQLNLQHHVNALERHNQELETVLETTRQEYETYREWVHTWR